MATNTIGERHLRLQSRPRTLPCLMNHNGRIAGEDDADERRVSVIHEWLMMYLQLIVCSSFLPIIGVHMIHGIYISMPVKDD